MVSITFDDGCVSQYTLGQPLLAQRGYGATFYLISDYLTWGGYLSAGQARQLAADGHEIASHTRTHATLTTVSDAQLADELGGSQQDLVRIIGLPDVENFAAPAGAYDNRTLAAAWQYYRSHRNTNTHTNFRDTSHYHLGAYDCSASTRVDDVKALIDRAVAERSWLILYLHDLTTGTPAPGSNQFQASSLSDILDYLALRNVKVVTVREGLALMDPAPSVPPRTPVDSTWLTSWTTMSEPLAVAGRYAQRFAEQAAATYHLLDNQSMVGAPSGQWELTAIAHADTRTGLFLRISSAPPDVRAEFDLAQGVVHSISTDGTVASASIDDLGDGWYRCRLVVTTPMSPNHADVGLLDASFAQSYSGDGRSGLYLSEVTLGPPSLPLTTTHFAVTAPQSTPAGSAFNFTVTALDRNNDRVASYPGTVQFTSTDGQATLPPASILTNGTGTFSATLRTPGGQTLTATDSVTSTIAGTSSIVNVSAPQYVVAVSRTGPGMVSSTPDGIACGTTCSASYPSGTLLTLSAVPDADSAFVGWSGACSGTKSCKLTMTENVSVGATFGYLLKVSLSGNGKGSVSVSPPGATCSTKTCSYAYPAVTPATAVTLSPVPAAGYRFGGWSGACTGPGACTVTMDAAKSVTATFTR